MFADDTFLGKRKDNLGNALCLKWHYCGRSFFLRSLKCSWLFSLLGLSPVQSRTFCCLNIKTPSDVWLWTSCDQTLQRPVVWLSIGTWAELRRKVFGLVARKLAWLSSTDVLEKVFFSSLTGLILTPCCPPEDELMFWEKNPQKNKKNTSQTVK